MWEAKAGGNKVLWYESEEHHFLTVDGKKKELCGISRYLITADTYAPLGYTAMLKEAHFDYKTECKIDAVKTGYKVERNSVLNGKPHRQSGTIETDEKIYFLCGALMHYIEGPLKKGEDFVFAAPDLDDMDTNQVYFQYLGEKHFKLANIIEVWVDDAGAVVRGKHLHSEMEYRRSDEKKALGKAVTLPGYKAPDYRKGDTVSLDWLGLKMTRSMPSQYFTVLHNMSALQINDYMSDLDIEVFVYANVPPKADYAAALEKLKKLDEDSTYAAGKVQKNETGEFFTGEYKNDCKGVEQAIGRYYIFMRNKSAYVVTVAGRGDTFKRQQKQAEVCIDSIRFYKPVIKDRSFLTHVDPETGVEITRPHYGWVVVHIGKRMIISNPWTFSYGFFDTIPGKADPNVAVQGLQRSLNPTYMKKYTIDGRKAVLVRYEKKRENKSHVLTQVFVFMSDRTVLFTISVPKDDFKGLEKDIEQIMKSIKLPELTREETNSD